MGEVIVGRIRQRLIKSDTSGSCTLLIWFSLGSDVPGMKPAKKRFSGRLRRKGGKLRHVIAIVPTNQCFPAIFFLEGLNQLTSSENTRFPLRRVN